MIDARLRAALVGGLMAACTAGPPPQRPSPEASAIAGGAAAAARRDAHPLFVVAHEDDDVLFMNPDLGDDIRAGLPVETVYLTAGDAGKDTEYWMEREAGIRAAYAFMAGIPDAWTESRPVIAGKRLVRFTAKGRPDLQVTFVRLPDGNGDGSGYDVTGHASLIKLWNGEIAEMRALDGDGGAATRFGRADLVAVLGAILEEHRADHLHTLDSSELYALTVYDDHPDHVVSARLAFEASLGYRAPHRLSMYRAYNTSNEPVNLSPEQSVTKREIYKRYDAHYECRGAPDLDACLGKWDAFPGPYGSWMQRMYVLRSRDAQVSAAGAVWATTPAGELRAGDQCLEAAGGAVRGAACNGGRAQQWRVIENGQIRGVGGCLAAGPTVTVAACNGSAGQTWPLR